jgi:hypothetical protein
MVAPYCILLHPAASCCTLLHPAAPCCTLLHPAAPCCTLLQSAAPCFFSDKPHITDEPACYSNFRVEFLTEYRYSIIQSGFESVNQITVLS